MPTGSPLSSVPVVPDGYSAAERIHDSNEIPDRSEPRMIRAAKVPRISPLTPSISDAAAFMALIEFFSSVTTIASGTTLITALSCASAARSARRRARRRPTRTPIHIATISATTQYAANATRAGVSIHVNTFANRTRTPFVGVVGVGLVFLGVVVAGRVDAVGFRAP